MVVHGPPDSLVRMAVRFPYVFDETIVALPGTSKPRGVAAPLVPMRTVSIAGMDVTPVPVPHGPLVVYAYRIGSLGYVTDAKTLGDEAVGAFRGVSVLVLNALFRTSHPTHMSIAEALDVARRIGAPRTYLTHLTHHNFHARLEAELPPGIAPAYDGLSIEID